MIYKNGVYYFIEKEDEIVIFDKNEKTIMLDTITPESILTEGHQSELETYKGVMVSKEHSDKDIFKINLLNMIQK